jgi:tetratricopeptide (TPR) repeat protein
VRTELRKGNGDYKQEKYTEAEIAYRKALELNAQSKEAAYNLGSALYRQGKFDEAARQYEMSAGGENNKTKVAESMHNYGNSCLAKAIAEQAQASQQPMSQPQNPQASMQSLEQSIDAYKQALRNNPADDETRYNLALAQKLLEQEKQNQQQQDQNQQDQKQDKKDQQNQDQQKQKQDQKQQQQEQQNQQQQQMERDKAEQILEAMKQNERETQEKVKEQQMRQVQQRKTDKNW